MAKSKSTNTFNGLEWPELIPGTLIKRYKRFLADVKLKNGTFVTAHWAAVNPAARSIYPFTTTPSVN